MPIWACFFVRMTAALAGQRDLYYYEAYSPNCFQKVTRMKYTDPKTLRSKTYQVLCRKVSVMRAENNRFAPEDDIAQELGVSRSTVREAMQRLQHEGHMTSRKGKGNFGHPSVSSLAQRVDLTSDFMKLLDNGKDTVVCRCLSSEEGEPSAAMRVRFSGSTDRVFRQNWLYSVSDAPMIFCRIETPLDLFIKSPEPPQEQFHFLRWLEEYCRLDVAYSSAHFSCASDSGATQALGLNTGVYMLRWQEIVFDLNDRAVSFADIYFHPVRVDLSMVLKY